MTWLLLALTVAGIVAWMLWPTGHQTPAADQRADERRRVEWARRTLQKMPAAWAAAGIKDRVPTVHAPGRWIEDGC